MFLLMLLLVLRNRNSFVASSCVQQHIQENGDPCLGEKSTVNNETASFKEKEASLLRCAVQCLQYPECSAFSPTQGRYFPQDIQSQGDQVFPLWERVDVGESSRVYTLEMGHLARSQSVRAMDGNKRHTLLCAGNIVYNCQMFQDISSKEPTKTNFSGKNNRTSPSEKGLRTVGTNKPTCNCKFPNDVRLTNVHYLMIFILLRAKGEVYSVNLMTDPHYEPTIQYTGLNVTGKVFDCKIIASGCSIFCSQSNRIVRTCFDGRSLGTIPFRARILRFAFDEGLVNIFTIVCTSECELIKRNLATGRVQTLFTVHPHSFGLQFDAKNNIFYWQTKLNHRNAVFSAVYETPRPAKAMLIYASFSSISPSGNACVDMFGTFYWGDQRNLYNVSRGKRHEDSYRHRSKHPRTIQCRASNNSIIFLYTGSGYLSVQVDVDKEQDFVRMKKGAFFAHFIL